MADLKTSQLTDGGAARPTDQVAAVRDGGNVKITMAGRAKLVAEAYTAVNGDDLLVDTSGGSFAVNVPAGGAIGMKFQVTDVAEAFDANPLTIGKNGQTIMGLDEDQSISTKGAVVEYFHDGSTWRIRGALLP